MRRNIQLWIIFITILLIVCLIVITNLSAKSVFTKPVFCLRSVVINAVIIDNDLVFKKMFEDNFIVLLFIRSKRWLSLKPIGGGGYTTNRNY